MHVKYYYISKKNIGHVPNIRAMRGELSKAWKHAMHGTRPARQRRSRTCVNWHDSFVQISIKTQHPVEMQVSYFVFPNSCFQNRRQSSFWILSPVLGGTRWRSWLRHGATSLQVTGSIPNALIGIFHWHYSSGRTMALGSTRTLTEIVTGICAAG
jgi:hypothetical protein